MPGRILTLQRQVRELGRLRAGLSVPASTPGKMRPKASPNWILTSPNRDYIDAAAAIWGGPVDLWQPLGNGPQVWRVITERPRIPAILPPGDPINQAYEMWSAGGCQRRCDGETEQRSQQPCLCRAQFGDDFHKQPQLDPNTKKPQRCQIHTRLGVFLPDLPDVGMWRVESHGYWPGVHITGYVELIKGQVGPQAMVPIGLGIEPRTKVTDGKTSHYVEIVVSLWNPVTFGEIAASPQVLAIGGPADDRVIVAAPQRPALEPPPANGAARPDYVTLANDAKFADDVRNLYKQAHAAGHLTEALIAKFQERVQDLTDPDEPTAGDGVDWAARIAAASTVDELRLIMPAMNEAGVSDPALRQAWWARKKELEGGTVPTDQAEPEPDRTAAWTRILGLGGDRGWDLEQTAAEMKAAIGKDQFDADGWAMSLYADQLAGQVAS